MNMYRVLGDRVGTLEGRALGQQLVEWHDAMVKHLRVANHHGRGCAEGCPHDEARGLWSAAMEIFGDEARTLSFLQTHGAVHPRRASASAPEVHA